MSNYLKLVLSDDESGNGKSSNFYENNAFSSKNREGIGTVKIPTIGGATCGLLTVDCYSEFPIGRWCETVGEFNKSNFRYVCN